MFFKPILFAEYSRFLRDSIGWGCSETFTPVNVLPRFFMFRYQREPVAEQIEVDDRPF